MSVLVVRLGFDGLDFNARIAIPQSSEYTPALMNKSSHLSAALSKAKSVASLHTIIDLVAQHRYVSEFEYRYNTRHLEDGERTVMAIRKAVGKRLLYKQPVTS